MPLGPDRESAAQRAEQRGEQDRDRDRRPPRPFQADLGDGALAEDGDEIGGEGGDGHLDQTDDPAIAG
jgi:hypothetical protein